MSEKKIGYCKWFNNKKGYGFLTVEDEDKDVFVHFSNILMDGFKKLDVGDKVQFDVEETDGKGPEALNVEIMVKDRRY